MILLSRQHIVAAAAIFILIGATVESLVPPFSPSKDQRHRQFPSTSVESPTSSVTQPASFSTPNSSRCRILTKSRATASTSLFATSLDSSEFSLSEIDEDDTKKTKMNGSQDELSSPVSKFRQLKDIMWIRETLEDWTGAEFALSVEQQSEGVNGNQSSPAARSTITRKTKKRAVDYEKLMTQLTKRIEDMTCQSFIDYAPLVDDEGVLRLDENLGMGRYAYTHGERMMLMKYVQI